MYNLGWALMGYGLAGVFTTLIIFMLVIRLIVKLSPDRADENEEDGCHDRRRSIL